MIDVESTIKLLLSLGAAAGTVGTASVKLWRNRKARIKAYHENEDAKNLKLDNLGTTLDSLTPKIADIQYELKANGGGSLRDIITQMRNESAVERTARRLMNNVASFETLIMNGQEHEVSFVSLAYVAMTGLTRDDSEDGGWVRGIAPEDRDRVSMLAHNSMTKGIVFSTVYTAQHVTTGTQTVVEHTGTPVFNYAGVVVGWIGIMRPIAGKPNTPTTIIATGAYRRAD